MAATPDGRFQKRLTTQQAVALQVDIANGMSKAAAGRKYGVSESTVYRILGDKYKPKRVPQPCGTNAAYQRHRVKGEQCHVCSAAHAANQKEWSDGKKRA